MSDRHFASDYGEDLVLRYGSSGLTRREFAAQSGISVSTLDYYVRRERKASLPAGFPLNRILPVDLVASDEDATPGTTLKFPGGLVIRLANGRSLEVERGLDAQLLRDVLAVLEEG